MSSELASTGVTVLVVDDYEDNRRMYAELLACDGIDVIEASNGAEGIEAALAHVPDLIVMDLSLPIIDGWEATRRLKGDSRTKHIPILAVSGHAPEALDGHSPAAEAAGCDGFLAKPCSPEKLLEMVHHLLESCRAVGETSGRARAPLSVSGG